jgi:multiple sugar transport system ATP-binding protein
VRSGDKASLWLDAERLHLFDPQSGENLTRRIDEHDPEARSPQAPNAEISGRHAASAG